MSTPFANVSYTVKKASDGEVVATGITDATGKAVVNVLPDPAGYIVFIDKPLGHVLDNSVISVPGQADLESSATFTSNQYILAEHVNVVEGAKTVVVNNFLTT